MLGWILFAVVLTVVGAVLTITWWKVGDQWADEEHRKFGRRSDHPSQSQARVISDFKRPEG